MRENITKKIKSLRQMKRYFEEMKETCEKMLYYSNLELGKLKRRKRK